MNHYFGTLPNSSCLFLDEHDLGERDGHAALMIFLISPNESVCTKKEGSGIKFYLREDSGCWTSRKGLAVVTTDS